MDNQKVSVIMGIYNCADTLPDAIESILNQTYTDIELIMCDDGSTDNTYSIAELYAEKNPEKIILLKNSKNMRLSYTLNKCLQSSSGRYVARMDGDDISLPDRIEKQVSFLREHPEYVVVGTAMQRFSDEGDGDIQFGFEHPDKYTLHKMVPFNHATILTYKYVYDKLGGYTVSERTRRSQDYDLWFRFYALGYNGDSLREPLYRVREDINAIKRRTLKNRWQAFQTAKIGYKMLGYPKIWLIKPAFAMLKGFVPAGAVLLYRKYESKKAQKKKSQ